MNINGKSIELILGEIRERHTGKMPFGVADDLCVLISEIEAERRDELNHLLDELETDAFWGDFVKLAKGMMKQ